MNSIGPVAVQTRVMQTVIDAGAGFPNEVFQNLLITRFASCEEVAELVV